MGLLSPGPPGSWPWAGPSEDPGVEKARHARCHYSDLTARPIRGMGSEPGANSALGASTERLHSQVNGRGNTAFRASPDRIPGGLRCTPILPQVLKILSRVEPPTRDPRIPGGPRAPRAGYAGTARGRSRPAPPLSFERLRQGASPQSRLSLPGSFSPLLFPPLHGLFPPPHPARLPFQWGPTGASLSAVQAVGSWSHPFQNSLDGNWEADWEQELGGLEKTRSDLTRLWLGADVSCYNQRLQVAFTGSGVTHLRFLQN